MTWRYFHTHALVALLIDASTVLALGVPFGIGGAFYAIREVWQWRRLGYWDGPGFWWPVVASAALTAGFWI